MPMIAFDNVSKWYGEFQVLTDCTTKVEKGEVIVVCGPSGSGKSTLIKCVNALEPFQKGQIVVDGIAQGMPEPAPPRRLEALGDDFGGGRVLAQDEGAHQGIAEIGVMHRLDQRA